MSFPKLSLPDFDYRTKKENNRVFIFDLIRRKYVFLTPEEWVRQHFVNFLLEKKFPASHLAVEKALIYNGLSKRTDIVAYDPHLKPYLLVECKNATIPIVEAHLEQAAMYNYELKAPYLVLTNGLQTFTAKIDHVNRKFELLTTFPSYQC